METLLIIGIISSVIIFLFIVTWIIIYQMYKYFQNYLKKLVSELDNLTNRKYFNFMKLYGLNSYRYHIKEK